MSLAWLDIPCSSWRRARYDITGGGPRSKQHIYGVPNLSAADQARAVVGHFTLRVSVRIMSKCIGTHTLVFLENPRASMLFDAPPIWRLRAKARECVSDYCRYNALWRNRTKVLVWRADITHAPTNTCERRGGILESVPQPAHRVERSAPHTTHSVDQSCRTLFQKMV